MIGTLPNVMSVVLATGKVWAPPCLAFASYPFFHDGIPSLLRFASFVRLPADPMSSEMLEWLRSAALMLTRCGQRPCEAGASPIFSKNVVVFAYSFLCFHFVSLFFLPPLFP